MPRLQQGTVVWAQLPAPLDRWPVVILTRDSAIGRLNGVTVAPITRTIRRINTEVLLEPVDGVPSVSAISLDNILTVPKNMFDNVVAVLSRQRMIEVFAAIRRAFDMP